MVAELDKVVVPKASASEAEAAGAAKTSINVIARS